MRSTSSKRPRDIHVLDSDSVQKKKRTSIQVPGAWWNVGGGGMPFSINPELCFVCQRQGMDRRNHSPQPAGHDTGTLWKYLSRPSSSRPVPCNAPAPPLPHHGPVPSQRPPQQATPLTPCRYCERKVCQECVVQCPNCQHDFCSMCLPFYEQDPSSTIAAFCVECHWSQEQQPAPTRSSDVEEDPMQLD
jgi:hypothetical protein